MQHSPAGSLVGLQRGGGGRSPLIDHLVSLSAACRARRSILIAKLITLVPFSALAGCRARYSISIAALCFYVSLKHSLSGRSHCRITPFNVSPKHSLSGRSQLLHLCGGLLFKGSQY